MLEKYLGGLTDIAGGLLQENNLPVEKADDLVAAGTEALEEKVMGEATSGNITGALGFLNGENGGLLDGLKGSLVEKITSKLGLDSGMASGLAASFLPKIVDMIRGQFNDSDGNNDEANLTDFLGLDAGGLMDQAKDLLGGKLGGLFS